MGIYFISKLMLTSTKNYNIFLCNSLIDLLCETEKYKSQGYKKQRFLLENLVSMSLFSPRKRRLENVVKSFVACVMVTDAY